MRFVATGGLLVLAACSPQSGNAKERAEACVRGQVKSGARVSSAQAYAIVGNCQQDVGEWLDLTMHRAVCQGLCDYSDPRIRAERRERRDVIERILMSSVSDDVEPIIIM